MQYGFRNEYGRSGADDIKYDWFLIILTQSAAVNAAVNAFNKELLANHIKGCVARDIREGKDEVIDELVATLQKLMK